MASTLALALVGVFAVYFFLRALLRLTQDDKEPPAVETTIPFLSPILGMLTHKSNFHTHMRDATGLPVYTLRMPWFRLYVVNSAPLITAVQRQFLTIAFPPIEAKAARHGMGGSKAAFDVLANDMMADGSYLRTYDAAIHPAVTLGPELDELNRASVRVLAAAIDDLQERAPQTTGLLAWVRHSMLMATTAAVFGPRNPFDDPAIEAAWLKFEPDMMFFMLNLFPRVLARESFQAREKVAAAFDAYYRAEAHLDPAASGLTKRRYQHNTEHGIPAADIGYFEIGSLFALLGSTLPAAFWMICHIFADPALLDSCRRELQAVVSQDVAGDNQLPAYVIDIARVRASCPVLLATLQEVLRVRGISTSARVVLEDHVLDGRYLLKKGATVLVPGPVQHSDPAAWGPTVGVFDHTRFLRGGKGKRHNPVAFRAFGGGVTLCPGRHFATTEILALAALMVLRFDVQPVANGVDVPWSMPPTINTPMAAAVATPDHDVDVEIRLRGPRDQRWRVELSGSGKLADIVGIVAEDIDPSSAIHAH
ncbi:cytochrome P450 oxidoreductase [Lasiosphaeria miniovina]|uniref:Cytochrome P450 oxidoreductase n=1 Tax=Lasiosphaeria miniovina TaxID=1954250 RepID=A0AA40EB73_9PEZI|nr:cytochrome P450 oxidoreductase [Lasiosphaeria miniovina]KAK0735124.1 cytochrome P450 oxidoreductase [Lasiosphaeria miniovina]